MDTKPGKRKKLSRLYLEGVIVGAQSSIDAGWLATAPPYKRARKLWAPIFLFRAHRETVADKLEVRLVDMAVKLDHVQHEFDTEDAGIVVWLVALDQVSLGCIWMKSLQELGAGQWPHDAVEESGSAAVEGVVTEIERYERRQEARWEKAESANRNNKREGKEVSWWKKWTVWSWCELGREAHGPLFVVVFHC